MRHYRHRTCIEGVVRWCRWCLVGLLVGGFGLVVATQPAAAQDEGPCEEALEAAEAAYLDSDFDAAIRLVSPCLDRDDVSDEQAVRAYRLLSLAHLQQDELPEARSAIVNILSMRPGYEADPVEDPPSYVSLVSIVRSDVQPAQLAEETDGGDAEEERSTPFFRRTSTWLSIAGSLLVGGVVTLVTVGQGGGGDNGGGSGGSDSLPEPPGTPSGH